MDKPKIFIPLAHAGGANRVGITEVKKLNSVTLKGRTIVPANHTGFPSIIPGNCHTTGILGFFLDLQVFCGSFIAMTQHDDQCIVHAFFAAHVLWCAHITHTKFKIVERLLEASDHYTAAMLIF